MGAIKAVVGDALITFMWMFCVSALGAATAFITSALQIQSVPLVLFITTTLVFLIVFVFSAVADAFGGASFNPAGSAAFYAAGLGNDNLITMALRFPAQAAGAVGGALAISEVMPPQYKHTLVGPALKVDLHMGAIAEGVLTFVINMAVLWIVIKGPRSAFVKTWLIAVSTVALVLAGAGYTGPSMNPVNAFGWAYINNLHNTWEQFYVYWICPFIGAIFAGWLFRIVFPLPKKRAEKPKRA
ncbi:aquaporin SIP1-2 [Canna indica]|uniref:Aquaporin SIP1-2 n=1 Tax=Canna indica TaxID=4628 RepID=A0AAQ3KW02_9LILI|nr:aquaporin SIP1-2 [Canna indica]